MNYKNISKQRDKKNTLELWFFTWNCENTGSPIWLNSGMELLSLVKLSDFSFFYGKMLQMFSWTFKVSYFWIGNYNSNKRDKKRRSICFLVEAFFFSWNCKNCFCNFETKFFTCCLCVSMNRENTSSLWLISGMKLLYLVKLSDFLNFTHKTQTNKQNKNYIRKILQVFFLVKKHDTDYHFLENTFWKCTTTHYVLVILKRWN